MAPRCFRGRPASSTAVVAAAAAAAALLPPIGLSMASANMVTATCEVGSMGTCAIMGDPHLLTFDRPEGPTFDSFRPGVYHLVKSAELSINGLFSYTKRFPSAASLTGFSVEGSSIGNHQLVFEFTGPAEWQDGVKVLWDTKPILMGYPSAFECADSKLRAHSFRMNPASAHKAGGTLPAYEFHFDNGLFIYAVLGPDFVNAIVQMRKTSAQDGYCGNFNCNPIDDSTQDLTARGLASPIPPAGSIFATARTFEATQVQPEPLVVQCSLGIKQQAETICKDSGSKHMIDACVYDTCASGNVRIAPVVEAIARTFGEEIMKLRQAQTPSLPAVPNSPPSMGSPAATPTAQPGATPAPPTEPLPGGHGEESQAPPGHDHAGAGYTGAAHADDHLHVHVGCPCANGSHEAGHCPCAAAGAAAHCPCAAHPGQPCPCAHAQANGMAVHVGCPCSAGHMAAPCPCAQTEMAHIKHCSCLQNHSAATPCPCVQAALAHCPCMQAATHCPCAGAGGGGGGLTPQTTSPGPTGSPGPVLQCHLNCYGDGAEAVELPGSSGSGDAAGVEGLTLETCRDFCLDTDTCEGIVFGSGKCHGRKNIVTSRCQSGNGDFTTEVLRGLPLGICGLFGDPHVVPFDNPHGEPIDQMAGGEFVLVTSAHLQINGRFGFSERFPSESSTVGIAITGALIGNHRLTVQYVGPTKGRDGFMVFWDGKQILKDFPSELKTEDGVLRAEYGMMNPDDEHPHVRHTIGGAHGSGDLPSYRFNFIPGWKIYILLGEQIMNAVIEVQKQIGGVDGYCGNFNCDASDDTLEALKTRSFVLAAPVPQMASLFVGTPDAPGFEMKTEDRPFEMSKCEAGLKARAEEACTKMPHKSEREACVYDACASGKISMAQQDVAVEKMEDHLALHDLCAKFFSGLLGGLGGGDGGAAAMALPLIGITGLLAAGALAGCTMLGRASRGSQYEFLDGIDEGLSHSGRLLDRGQTLLGALSRGSSLVTRARGPSFEVASEHAALAPNGSRRCRDADLEGCASDEEQRLLA